MIIGVFSKKKVLFKKKMTEKPKKSFLRLPIGVNKKRTSAAIKRAESLDHSYLQKLVRDIKITSFADVSDDEGEITEVRNSRQISLHSEKNEKLLQILRKKAPTCIRDDSLGKSSSVSDMKQVKIIASMVPDEILYNCHQYSGRDYNAALMFADVSGFTELCEKYTKTGKGGTSRLTQVLNSYIGAMVQEILSHSGDLLKFSGDAFLAMWKSGDTLSMQEAVHAAIDCALVIQRDYGAYQTDVGVVLRVKVAISGGSALFSLVGDNVNSHYAVVGQPVWDVKKAEYMSQAGDVIASPSAWKYVNPVQYITKPSSDGEHTKIIGIGATWRNVDKDMDTHHKEAQFDGDVDSDVSITEEMTPEAFYAKKIDDMIQAHNDKNTLNYRRSVNYAVQCRLKEPLRRFMLAPVMKAVENDEPMEYLTEMRHVVVLFLNIITEVISVRTLMQVLDKAYRNVCRLVTRSQGIVNKVSLFDKDMMFLVVFGLRGLKHELETQFALRCAVQLRHTLIRHTNIKSVSIGVTSGLAYCGVVGHTLRREYTVIGLCVNKGARLMVAYPDKVTCDKETFLRSKLHSENFTMMKCVLLKGLTNVGPVYEFREKTGLNYWPTSRPIIGRHLELKTYKTWLDKNMGTHSYGAGTSTAVSNMLVIKGEALVGKSRLMEEMLSLSADCVRMCKVYPNHVDKKKSYFILHKLLVHGLRASNLPGKQRQDVLRHKLRQLLRELTVPPQLHHLVSQLFSVSLDSTQQTQLTQQQADNVTTQIVSRVIHKLYGNLCLLAVDRAENIDDGSWGCLCRLLAQGRLLLLVCVDVGKVPRAPAALRLLQAPSTQLLSLQGLNRRHHSALLCQLLDVHAVPPELEMYIQTYSQGIPGWIKNLLQILIQGRHLYIKLMSRDEAIAIGAVVPPQHDLKCPQDNSNSRDRRHASSTLSKLSVNIQHEGWTMFQNIYKENEDQEGAPKETLQVAVMEEGYVFENLEGEQTMDVIFLKTYDSLTPFEKLLLKCSSVLGEIFSREMLVQVLQVEATRQVAIAVSKLFDIGFLECGGGDFTRSSSTRILICTLPDPSPGSLGGHTRSNRHCRCLGITHNDLSSDLPHYAWCGYIRFCNTMFRTSTYDLLTESQKKMFHSRAVTFLEENACRCLSCGEGSFKLLLGLTPAKTRKATVLIDTEETPFNFEGKGLPRVHSYSNLDFSECECEMILSAMYTQIIEHCRKSDQYHKMIEAHTEYACVCISCDNIPQALAQLLEVEAFIKGPEFVLGDNNKHFLRWQHNFILARVYSIRGQAMSRLRDLPQARQWLLQALALMHIPYPTTRSRRKSRLLLERLKQKLKLQLFPNMCVGMAARLDAVFYNQAAHTLSHMFHLCQVTDDGVGMQLSAVWGLNLALEANDDFVLMCRAYGNMLVVGLQLKNVELCRRLGALALQHCYTNKPHLDISEMKALAYVYAAIIQSRCLWVSQLSEDTALSWRMLPVLRMSCALGSSSRMLVRLLVLLMACDLRAQAHALHLQLTTTLHTQDVTSLTWYYGKCVDIHLDTGLTLEPQLACTHFYKMNFETLKNHVDKEAMWHFIICMWLRCVRMMCWESAAMLEDKVVEYVRVVVGGGGGGIPHSPNSLTVLRLAEGLLLHLVWETNNKNPAECTRTRRMLAKVLPLLRGQVRQVHTYQSRFLLMLAYHRFLTKNDGRVGRLLEEALQRATHTGHVVMQHNITQAHKAWEDKLSPAESDAWLQHCVPGQEIMLADACGNTSILPYTLPVPHTHRGAGPQV